MNYQISNMKSPSEIKIAIVTPFGAEERLDQFAEFLLAQGLVKRGYKVKFYTYKIRSSPGYVEDGAYKGVDTMRCSQKLGLSPKLFWNIIKWKPDIVILNHIRSFINFSGYIAAKIIKAKTVFQVVGFLHDPDVVSDRDNPLDNIKPQVDLIHSVVGLINKILKTKSFTQSWVNYVFHFPLYKSDVRVTITEFERSMLLKLAGLDSSVIPWGVKIAEQISGTEPKMSDGRELPDQYLFYIGQVKLRKGWDTIIQALNLLKKEGVKRNLVFVTTSSPNDFKSAEEMVKALDLEEQVFFLHKISNQERAWLYRHARATLAPSRYEGFGLTVFESWAEGVPVLGTDIPVYSDFMLDGQTALVSKKGDPVSLAQNIKRLDEPGMHERLVNGGLLKVAEYSDDRIVDNFLRVMGV